MKLKKAIYVVVGCLGVGLGAVGAVVPMLPAFPFLMLAAFCFAKSSRRLHTWFTHTKLYREMCIRDRGFPVQSRAPCFHCSISGVFVNARGLHMLLIQISAFKRQRRHWIGTLLSAKKCSILLEYRALCAVSYTHLAKKNSHFIGLIVPSADNFFFSCVIASVERYASAGGYKLLLCVSNHEIQKEKEFFSMLLGNKVAGIILASHTQNLEEFADVDAPVITLTCLLYTSILRSSSPKAL